MIPDHKNSLPAHIAVIMDGNNRWARARGMTGTAGHRAGAESARDLVDGCIARNIDYLTLFAFSSENWLRPKKEVQGLMALFLAVLKRKEIDQFHAKNVRVRFIGRRDGFSKKLAVHMHQVEQLTAENTGLTVTVAADYGGRWDIVQAANRLAAEVETGRMTSAQIDEQAVERVICLTDAPAPDLCIRTGGERRISNFLLWQFAYTELYFTDCYWPDFDDTQLQLALDDYASRQRRFGSHPDSA
ncbi:MAG: polyprenyl diphosphate synthase [Gammaproteobacteria bacterium]|nr:di-trans,poly-cis-decaprenylcistransferase [Pseudomonadales bacterium]MCP5346420.1 di-trans,poly-cis-decaprenylcistransferase [Pseudomonadales bacterium]